MTRRRDARRGLFPLIAGAAVVFLLWGAWLFGRHVHHLLTWTATPGEVLSARVEYTGMSGLGRGRAATYATVFVVRYDLDGRKVTRTIRENIGTSFAGVLRWYASLYGPGKPLRVLRSPDDVDLDLDGDWSLRTFGPSLLLLALAALAAWGARRCRPASEGVAPEAPNRATG